MEKLTSDYVQEVDDLLDDDTVIHCVVTEVSHLNNTGRLIVKLTVMGSILSGMDFDCSIEVVDP